MKNADGLKRESGKVMKKTVLFKRIVLAVMLIAVLVLVSCNFKGCTASHTHTISSELMIIKEANCAEEGIAHMFCTECGEIVNTISIAKTNNHTEETIPAVESTCKVAGLTEGKKCSVCNKILISQTEAPLKKHTEETILAVESTCTQKGLTEGKKCSVCGDILVVQQESPLKAHTYDNDDDANCNVCGYEKYCAHHNTKILPKVDPTCTSTGLTEGKQCIDCGEILIAQEDITTISHTEVVDPSIEPTCTSTGVTEGRHCSVCGTIIIEQNILNMIPHTFSEWITVKEATTIVEGLKERICTCGKKETETIPVKISESSAYVREGDYIYFGEYPQTIKADDVTVTENQDNRGYYLGSDGNYYAKVTANPDTSMNSTSTEITYTFSNGATVEKDYVYYFKVEPIRWRILSEENGEAFLFCDSIIANHRFDDNSNNYAESEIRVWLNSTFYETAFTYLQQAIILTTEVDNSAKSTNPYGNETFMNNGVNQYACENTNDKIFLLSVEEATNSAYGFSPIGRDDTGRRKILTSDFSRATGAFMNISSNYYGNGDWWPRSPSPYINNSLMQVFLDDGSGPNGFMVYTTCLGVVPALRIQIEEEKPYTRDGDYIYFGEYPQTIKADDVTITETRDNRGYYLGSDGNYYAKVTAKPDTSMYSTSTEITYTFSNGATVKRNYVYYFKVEPIRWRILSEENGEAFLFCDSIIANHRFDDNSNNYAESEIRVWLNSTFYETAFTYLQQAIILTTEVDNSAKSTNPYGNETFMNNGVNQYACENTNDKIFLLSVEEATNSAYGFSPHGRDDTGRRKILTSDFSRAMGAFMIYLSNDYGNGKWVLRSPLSEDNKGMGIFTYDGSGPNGFMVYATYLGVVPALRITL